MANIYKNKIDIGGKQKTLITINHTEEAQQQKTETKTVDSIHHIHILDRSGSMGWEINGLIENVKQTIEAMHEDDVITVIWFSGENQCEVVFSGMNKDNKKLDSILDRLKSTVGLTCFSTPLQKVDEVLEKLIEDYPNVSITLFTDGEPCISNWSYQEEDRRIFAAIDKFKDKVLALNTVGYGYYYNQELLRRMAEQTTFGTLVHSSKINEYLDIFNHNFEKIVDLVAESVEIKVPSGVETLYLNSSLSKLSRAGGMKLNRLEKKKNQFFLISDSDFTFEFNGEVIDTKTIDNDKVHPNTITNFYYAYAYELHYFGFRRDALEIMAKNILDKKFIDKQLNAFTFDELSSYRKELKRAIFKPKYRMQDGEAPEGYLPREDAFCVMDLLTVLQEGYNFYIPAKDYNRIGVKTVDESNAFIAKDEEIRSPISDFVFNKEKMNLSIRYAIKGEVKLNPKTAARVNLPKVFTDSQIYRMQTIIKDGNLNMNFITVVVDKKTYDEIQRLESEHNVSVIASSSVEGDSFKITLQLNVLPVINYTYVNESANVDSIHDSFVKINSLEAQQKVINHFNKAIKAANAEAAKEGIFANLTEEQIEVLKEHGIAKDGTYGGIDNQKEEPTDFYETRELIFTIKGIASLPSVNAVLKKHADMQDPKSKKKFNTGEQIIFNYIEALRQELRSNGLDLDNPTVELRDYLTAKLQLVKKELIAERNKINSIKIAKVLTGDWFEGLETDDDGNQMYTKNGITLLLKTRKVRVEI